MGWNTPLVTAYGLPVFLWMTALNAGLTSNYPAYSAPAFTMARLAHLLRPARTEALAQVLPPQRGSYPPDGLDVPRPYEIGAGHLRGWSWPRHPLRLAALAGTGIMWACTKWVVVSQPFGSEEQKVHHQP